MVNRRNRVLVGVKWPIWPLETQGQNGAASCLTFKPKMSIKTSPPEERERSMRDFGISWRKCKWRWLITLVSIILWCCMWLPGHCYAVIRVFWVLACCYGVMGGQKCPPRGLFNIWLWSRLQLKSLGCFSLNLSTALLVNRLCLCVIHVCSTNNLGWVVCWSLG